MGHIGFAQDQMKKMNVAQQLRAWLGVKSRSQGRSPVVHRSTMNIEPLEARMLLSADAFVLPPSVDRQAAIVSPMALDNAARPEIHALASLVGMNLEQQMEMQINEIIFVDPKVPQAQTLIDELLRQRGDPGSPANIELVVLDAESDGLRQISQWLAQREGIRAVHIISHGAEGALDLGSQRVDTATLQKRTGELSAWSHSLTEQADVLIYGCDVAQDAQGRSFIEQFASLTGADVAASADLTGWQSLGGDWDLEYQTGQIETQGLKSTVYQQVLALPPILDPAQVTLSKDGDLDNNNSSGADVDAEHIAVLEQMYALVGGAEQIVRQALSAASLNANLPGLGQSALEVLGIDGDTGGTATYGITGLQSALATLLSDDLTGDITLDLFALNLRQAWEQEWGDDFDIDVNPYTRWTDSGLALGLSLSVHRELSDTAWSSSAVGGYTPLGLLRLTARAALELDLELRLDSVTNAQSVATQRFSGDDRVSQAQQSSFVDFRRFVIQLDAQTQDASLFQLHLGTDARMVGPDNRSGISLADWSDAVTEGQENLRIQLSQDAWIAGQSGATTFVKGSVDAGTGVLSAAVSNSNHLFSVADQARLNQLFETAREKFSVLDTATALNTALGMAGQSLNQMFLTQDGRTLSDVLSFRTAAGSNVWQDYLVSTGSSSVSLAGLLDAMRQYLSGTGVYAGLDPVMSAALAANMLSATASAGSFTLNVNGKLNRQILSRFTLDNALTKVGFNFALDGGVPLDLNAEVNTSWSVATGTTATVTAQLLDLTVKDRSSGIRGSLNADVLLGILDAKAVGTLQFETALLLTDEDLVFDSEALRNSPEVIAEADFEVEGYLPIMTGSLSFESFANGALHFSRNLNGQGVYENQIDNFGPLQQFAMLSASDMTLLLRDVGIFLQTLRDSGQFDALIPFTNVHLGQAADFSALMTESINSQLMEVNASGILGESAVSPVLARDVSFNLVFKRPGESNETTLTVVVDHTQTTGFTHVRQLAELIDRTMATALAGVLQWSDGEGSLPNQPLADVQTRVQGGVRTTATNVSDEVQRVDLHLSSGAYRLKLGDQYTQWLYAQSNSQEVQNALQQLADVGAGNVLVTGKPRHFDVEFGGQLARRDIATIEVEFDPDAQVGGWLEAQVSDLIRGEDGKVWGKLNLLEVQPGYFDVLKVAPNTGATIETVTPGGGGTVNEVQRLTLVYADSGTLTLSGADAGGSVFNVDLELAAGDNEWADNIQASLNLALGAGQVSVSASNIELPSGVYAYDISFSGNAVDGVDMRQLAVNFSRLLGSVGVQAAAFEVQRPAPAVGAADVQSEIQRIALANVVGGELTFSFSANGTTFQTEPIEWLSTTDEAADIATMAEEIELRVFDILHEADPDLSRSQVLVTAVSGLPVGTRAFDIEFIGLNGMMECGCSRVPPGSDTTFGGDLQGKDMPQLTIHYGGLHARTIAQGTPGLDALSKLGFALAGQDNQQTSVTTFTSLTELMARFQAVVNRFLDSNDVFEISPRYDQDSNSFLFDLKLTDRREQGVDLSLPSTVLDDQGRGITDLGGSAALNLQTSAVFQTTVGINLNELLPFDLIAAGLKEGVIAATLPLDSGVLSGSADFFIDFDGETYQVNVTGITRDNLPTRFAAALTGKSVTANGVLASRGFSNLGQLVTLERNGDMLALKVRASVDIVQVAAAPGNAFVEELGFRASGNVTYMDSPKGELFTGVTTLGSNADFDLVFNQDMAHQIAVSVTAGIYANLPQLVSAINATLAGISAESGTNANKAAFQALGLTGHLGDYVKAEITSVGDKLRIGFAIRGFASAEVRVQDISSAAQKLGLVNGGFGQIRGAEVFLQGASIQGSWNTTVIDQTHPEDLPPLPENPSAAELAQRASALANIENTNLKYKGQATLGMLDLKYANLDLQSSGEFSFDLRDHSQDGDATPPSERRLVLNNLFDYVNDQVAQLGFGADFSTKTSRDMAFEPVEGGRLTRDVGLTITLESKGENAARFDVVLESAATADFSDVSDLANYINDRVSEAFSQFNDGEAWYSDLDLSAVVGVETITRPTLVIPVKVSEVMAGPSAPGGVEVQVVEISPNEGGQFTLSGKIQVQVLIDGEEVTQNRSFDTAALQMPGQFTDAGEADEYASALATALNQAINTTLGVTGVTQVEVISVPKTKATDPNGFLVRFVGAAFQSKNVETLIATHTSSDQQQVLSFTSPKSGVTLGVGSKRLADRAMTTIEFDQLSADLKFGSLFMGALGDLNGFGNLRNGNTYLGLTVDNMAEVMRGDLPLAITAVVPPDGLGVLTPFKDILWSDVAAQLSSLGDLFGDLSGLGEFGELAQSLPMLRQSLAEVFDLSTQFDGIAQRLMAAKDVKLGDIEAALSEAFGADPADVLLSLDQAQNGQATALRVKLPVSILVDTTDNLDWLLDPAITALFQQVSLPDDPDTTDVDESTLTLADRLKGLLGTVGQVTDAKNTAPVTLTGRVNFNLDFGIDLTGTWRRTLPPFDVVNVQFDESEDAPAEAKDIEFVPSDRFGQVFLVDFVHFDETANASQLDFEGTAATFSLTVQGDSLAFEAPMGLFNTRVKGGEIDMSVDSSLKVDTADSSVTWLSDYKSMIDEFEAKSAAALVGTPSLATLTAASATNTKTLTLILPTDVADASYVLQVVVGNTTYAFDLPASLSTEEDPLAAIEQLVFDALGLDPATDELPVSVGLVRVFDVPMANDTTSLKVAMADPTATDLPRAWIDVNGRLNVEEGAEFSLSFGYLNRDLRIVQFYQTELITFGAEADAQMLTGALNAATPKATASNPNPDYVDFVGTGEVFADFAELQQPIWVIDLPTNATASIKAGQQVLQIDQTRDSRFELTIRGAELGADVLTISIDSVAGDTPEDLQTALQDALTGTLNAWETENGTLLGSRPEIALVQNFVLQMPLNVENMQVLTEEGAGLAWIDASGALNVTREAGPVRLAFDVLYNFGTSSARDVQRLNFQTNLIDLSESDEALQAISAAIEAAQAHLQGGQIAYADLDIRAPKISAQTRTSFALTLPAGWGMSLVQGKALAKAEMAEYRANNFDIELTGQASLVLPMAIVLSNPLADLASQALDGFVNPMPVGTLKASFGDLGAYMAYLGGKAFSVSGSLADQEDPDTLAVKLTQAEPPPRSQSGNGSGDAPPPAGAPVDIDYEGALARINPDPYTGATGTGTDPGDGMGNEGGGGGSSAPSEFDIDLVLPDFKYWQTTIAELLKAAGIDGCNPDEPENAGLLMMLRDPTIIVDNVDTVLGNIQSALEGLMSTLTLPFIGNQLQEAITFIADFRTGLIGSIREALESYLKIYGGVDNALRMYMFDALTDDRNNDGVIDDADQDINDDGQVDEEYNMFLNFLRDYNSDGLITADDIVIEYLLTSDQNQDTSDDEEDKSAMDEFLDETAFEVTDLGWKAGQRAAWVTAGRNVPITTIVDLDEGVDYYDAETFSSDEGAFNEPLDLGESPIFVVSVMQAQGYGDYQLVLTLQPDPQAEPIEITTAAIEFDADAAAVHEAILLALQVGFSALNVMGADLEVVQLTTGDDVNEGQLPPNLFGIRLVNPDIQIERLVVGDSCYTSYAGKVVIDSYFNDQIEEWAGDLADDEEAMASINQWARETVLEAATAIQFRMNLGQTFAFAQNLSFDLGLDAVPLELTLNGGLAMDINWDLYLGFGVDIEEGFYLITNMLDRAGIGAVSSPEGEGGFIANEDDEAIPNVWQLYDAEDPEEEVDGFVLFDKLAAIFDAPEEEEDPEMPFTEELKVSVNVYLKGIDSDGDGVEDTPASLSGRLLFLGGKLTDMWEESIVGPDGETYEVGETMPWADDEDNPRGTRTQLYASFSIDLTDGSQAEDASAEDSEDPPAEDPPAEDPPAEDPPAENSADEEEPVANGRLTFAKLMAANFTDLFEIKWSALAQVNLHGQLGLQIGSSLDFLPTVEADFHLTWGLSSEDGAEEDKAASGDEEASDAKDPTAREFLQGVLESAGITIEDGEDPEYLSLFSDSPSIWLTDIGLNLGTFFSEFLMPVGGVIMDAVGPLMPVIEALTTPIPGLSQIVGRDYSTLDLAVDMSKLFGGTAEVEFVVAAIKMVKTVYNILKIGAEMGTYVIPLYDVLVLSGAEEGEGDGADGETAQDAAANDNLDLKGEEADADTPEPGDEAATKESTDELQDESNSAGSALAFPIIEDLFGSAIDLLLGNPVDLVTFTPPDLKLSVEFRFGIKIFGIIEVGLGGRLTVGARLTLGFDTYGVMKFLDTKNVLDIFDGFYVSDNIVNGKDLPEIYLETRLFVYAELDLVIITVGIQGGIKLVGWLDLCDPNKDGKIRPSEIVEIVRDDPAALISVGIEISAYANFYIEVIILGRIVEITFFDIVLFSWEYNPCDRQPILAVMDHDTLIFNTGHGVGAIDGQSGIGQTAQDRRYRSREDGNETYLVQETNAGQVKIEATLPNNQTYSKSFSGVARIRGFAGNGNDTFDASEVNNIPVYFVAGAGHDVLIGGGADDVLVGSDTGFAELRGGGGNDVLKARGGVTTMLGDSGHDTYRFLGEWGDAYIYNSTEDNQDVGYVATDGLGRNVLDFSAQTKAVTLDDAYANAFQGGNSVQWLNGGAGTTIDLVRGGSGQDRLDFSGDEENLTLGITGTNSGWVTASSSGMNHGLEVLDQNDGTVLAAIPGGTDHLGNGFRFVGIENIIGGQGSDVFRYFDGASITGSVHGDTSQGLYQDSYIDEQGNAQTRADNLYARNTIDFSAYTTSVSADQENLSAFGIAGANTMVVRGFHNMFGGQVSDYLAGDGRNNLIVGNGGADTLDGRSGHDLLVADNFYTWSNISTRPVADSLPLVQVKDYLRLEYVGRQSGVGDDGRRWVWQSQTLENISLTTARQNLMGGVGNDIQMGALGSDVFNAGGNGDGNDTIMADLGRISIDHFYRAALSAETFGRRGGGNDIIYLGVGSNVVLAGSGDDTVLGSDVSDNINIVLGDNGKVKFQSVAVFDADGSSDLDYYTFAENREREDDLIPGQVAATYSNHMIDYIRAEQDEAPEVGDNLIVPLGVGGKDIITLASGSGIVIGGAAADVITFKAEGSRAGNVRFIAGDHAELIGDSNGGVVEFKSLDTMAMNGGNDTIQVGGPSSPSNLNMGRNFVIAGMGADQVFISAGLDELKMKVIGAASSEDVILGDNGVIYRTESVLVDSSTAVQNLMLQVKTLENDKGDNDVILTAHGNRVVVGGYGADTIAAGNGDQLVLGDNAQIDYDSVAKNGVIRSAVTTDIVIGGNDEIELGNGYKLVAGGFGSDTITVHANKGADATGESIWYTNFNFQVDQLLRVRGVLGVAATRDDLTLEDHPDADGDALDAINANNAVANHGRTGRFVLGDNAEFKFDDLGGLIRAASTDPIAATGGADTISISDGELEQAIDLGLNLVIAGMGADRVAISDVGISTDRILGDNGEYTRRSRSYAETGIASLVNESGGNDIISAGRGDKIVIGGTGADIVNLQTLSQLPALSDENPEFVFNRSIVVGDSGRVSFDPSGSGSLQLVQSLSLGDGGSDTVNVRDGDLTFIGGYGADRLSVNSAETAFRVMAGDNAEFLYAGTPDASLQAEDLIFAQTLDQDNATGDSDTLSVGNDGSNVGHMGVAILLGGVGSDRLSVFGEDASSLLMGDNGSVLVQTSADLPNELADGQLSLAWQNPSDYSYLSSVNSLLPEVGTGDTLSTIAGRHVLVGGAGSDQLTAGRGDAIVFGDGAAIDYVDGVLSNVSSFGISAGEGDKIELGAGSSLGQNNRFIEDGHKVVIGGIGSDDISLTAQGGDGDVRSQYRERAILGDNGVINFDARGRLILAYTLDSDISTSGNDLIQIQVGRSEHSGQDPSELLIMTGGLGDDSLIVSSAQRMLSVVGGDNLSVARTDASSVNLDEHYQFLNVQNLDPSSGGNDTIVLTAGPSVVFGGAGNDRISTSTTAADASVYFGDAGQINFDTAGTGEISQMNTLSDETGGDDIINVGAGMSWLFGGVGNDRMTVNAADDNLRIAIGDAGQVNVNRNGKILIQTAGDDANPEATADTLTLPGTGSTIVLGGAGLDTLNSNNQNARFVPGSGMVELDSANDYARIVSVTVLGAAGEFGYSIAADGTRVPGRSYGVVDGYELVERESDPDVEAGSDSTQGGSESQTGLNGSAEMIQGVNPFARGRIVYPSLTSGLATFEPQYIVGQFGTLSVARDGTWVYTLTAGDLADPEQTDVKFNQEMAVEAIPLSESREDLFTIQTTDGSTTSVSITVRGNPLVLNDSLEEEAIESGGVLNQSPGVNASGTVFQDATGVSFDGVQTAFVSAVRKGEISVAANTPIQGDYGRLVVTSGGAYVYTLDEAADDVEGIMPLENLMDIFTLTVKRGNMLEQGSLEIRINGASDTPVLSSYASAATRTEAGDLFASGSFRYNDVDLRDELTVTAAIATITATTSGQSFELTDEQRQALLRGFTVDVNADSARTGLAMWAYAISASDSDFLAQGDVVSLVFHVNVTDMFGLEATHRVTINLEGRNDVPLYMGDLNATIDSVTTNTISGQIRAIDGDRLESAFVFQSLEGRYGNLLVDGEGNWSYQLSQVVSPGIRFTEVFQVQSLDAQSTRATLNIVVQGPSASLVAAAAGGASSVGGSTGSSSPSVAASMAGAAPLSAAPAGSGSSSNASQTPASTSGSSAGGSTMGLRIGGAEVPQAMSLSLGTTLFTQTNPLGVNPRLGFPTNASAQVGSQNNNSPAPAADPSNAPAAAPAVAPTGAPAPAAPVGSPAPVATPASPAAPGAAPLETPAAPAGPTGATNDAQSVDQVTVASVQRTSEGEMLSEAALSALAASAAMGGRIDWSGQSTRKSLSRQRAQTPSIRW